jgi:transposase-like protein
MKSKYSEAFIEQALVKLFSRGDRTVQSVAEDLNVNYHTVKNWMKRKAVGKLSVPATNGNFQASCRLNAYIYAAIFSSKHSSFRSLFSVMH